MSIILSCGINNLDSPCMKQRFFPADLPADWRLDYYANEFKVLMIDEAQLDQVVINDDTPVQEHTLLDMIKQAMSQELVVLLSVSEPEANAARELPDNVLQVYKHHQFEFEGVSVNEYVLASTNRNQGKERQGTVFVTEISSDDELAPMQLRKLAEFLLARHEHDSYIVFNSPGFALENCRKMITMLSLL